MATRIAPNKNGFDPITARPLYAVFIGPPVPYEENPELLKVNGDDDEEGKLKD